MAEPNVRGLDETCTCGRRAGDHTLDEWAVCLNAVDHVLEYEETPRDVQDLMRRRFKGLEDYAIADTLVARAAVLDAASGAVGVAVPALLLEFATGHPTLPPKQTAKVAFLGPPEVMRQVGKLVRDTANGAANAAEKAS